MGWRNTKKYKSSPNKKVKNATALTVDGIKFRSKLEAYTYRQLKEAGIKSDYEEHKFILVDKFRYEPECYEPHKIKGEKVFTEVPKGVRAMTYTPDFVNLNDGWVIEVKGYANDVFPIKWKLFKNLIKDDSITLFLPSTQKQVRKTIEIIKSKYYEKSSEDVTSS